MEVGDLVKGPKGAIGIITHMSNHPGPGHPWVYVTISWSDRGVLLTRSDEIEVIDETR